MCEIFGKTDFVKDSLVKMFHKDVVTQFNKVKISQKLNMNGKKSSR